MVDEMGNKATTELDIVIPVYNNWRLTAQCIASIFKGNFEKTKLNIILVDNQSNDFTPKFIEYLVGEGEPITYVRAPENLGYVKGTNAGLRLSSARYVMLLNNDTILHENCISSMIKTMVDIDICGAIEFYPNGLPSNDKPFIYWKPKKLLDLERKGVDEVHKELEKGQSYVNVDVVGFACALVKREVFDKIGLYDELFSPCMYEQEDFQFRAKQAGFKIGMCVDAMFTHYVAATTSFDTPKYQKLIKIHRDKFIAKWVK